MGGVSRGCRREELPEVVVWGEFPGVVVGGSRQRWEVDDFEGDGEEVGDKGVVGISSSREVG